MLLPLEIVFRRGVVFLWTAYSQLDDPTLQGHTKPKYVVLLSGSPSDDPLVYILTTSEKAKHTAHPFPNDLVLIPAGTYAFFPVNTLLDAGQAGQLEVGRDEFVALYEKGAVVYQGALSEGDVTGLVAKILACARVSRRFKQMLSGT